MMKIQEFDYSINVEKALLWRHNKAVNLQALLANKQAALDTLHSDFWTAWSSDVFNLNTANDFGLIIWSIILGLPLTIDNESSPVANGNFGFGEFRKNFGNGNFTPLGDFITLNSEDARSLLKLRYYQLVTRATVPECNKIVNDVFPTLTPYVVDGLDMTMEYVFNGSPSSSLRDAIKRLDVLPRPSGVELSITYI
jgi:hypothetical protein